MKRFSALCYADAKEIILGSAPNPVRCGFDLTLGGGQVLPEINFTLPEMTVSPENKPEVLRQYEQMVDRILQRWVVLRVPGGVLEIEHTPQMTEYCEIGEDITRQTREKMQQAFETHGLKTALRVTVCDIRDKERPPRMRTHKAVETLFESFRANAQAGADLLSIESTGGKEVSDQALLEGDIPGLLLALGVLAPRDMHFLWRNIVDIAQETGVIAAGDTACGFANTAMVLADQGFLPNVLAAVVRAMSAARSLVAYEEGALGPSKDCAYEGPVIKAITGVPISMEGKAAACAHFSHMGNIAAAVCDLWSNESVQNVRLLSGYAPEVFAEILAYDCRLMNQAIDGGQAAVLQKWLVESDQYRSLHAFMISPALSFELARTLIAAPSNFQRAYQASVLACQKIREAMDEKKLQLPPRELTWLNRIEDQLAKFDTEEKVLQTALPAYQNALLPAEYGL